MSGVDEPLFNVIFQLYCSASTVIPLPLLGGIKQCYNPSDCLSICLFHALISRTVHFRVVALLTSQILVMIGSVLVLCRSNKERLVDDHQPGSDLWPAVQHVLHHDRLPQLSSQHQHQGGTPH